MAALSQSDQEYLDALKAARLAIVTGAQSYTVGSRSLTRANLADINAEIARVEGQARPVFRRAMVTDR